ncbi:nop5 ribonucleoprotein [Brevipalpus obovatus]|uniref:nop5 ribonucleoprotein n=1 Tax=Brevipalpus obovatus TaxID=246614 RepID=UPI003D9F2615
MLVLFENALGYAVFKLNDEKKLEKTDKLFKLFQEPDKASKLLTLHHFERFKDTSDAVDCASAIIEGKLSKRLKKMLKKIVDQDSSEVLAVADPKLAANIKEKLNISCNASGAVQELMSCIRSKVECLIPEWSPSDNEVMELGLSHGLSRYKLKFSPDKVDTMIIQAVSLLDNLDKELNNYVMRCKEWYGWHYPELAKMVPDNNAYIQTILRMGTRSNAPTTDFSDILPAEVGEQVKQTAEMSMGTDIAEEDMLNIDHLCKNVLEMQEYRSQLFEYLKNRMMAIAPNLTVLVGELVGARLITHAGSLMNLAKHPASTVQILGAEKALFRALKTRHDTPKYGLIYHAQLIGQSAPKIKGKMSRMLAAKSALACRVDALGEEPGNSLGIEHKAHLETMLKHLEEGKLRKISGTGKAKAKWDKYEHKSSFHTYKPGADSTMPTSKKRKFDQVKVKEESQEQKGDESTSVPDIEMKAEEGEASTPSQESTKKKKDKKDKKKRKSEAIEGDNE